MPAPVTINSSDILNPVEPTPVTDLIDQAVAASSGYEVCLDDLIAELGPDSFVPVLLLPALAIVSPLSGIPLLSSFCGMIIAVVALQLVFRRQYLWLPAFIVRRKVRSRHVRAVFGGMRSLAQWVDDHSTPRFAILRHPPFSTLAYLFCALCGLVMPFLEVLPFTSSFLGGVVSLIALTMLTRDGLFALVAGMLFVTVIGGGAAAMAAI